MSEQRRTLILASTSPRRRELLRKAGFDFIVVSPGIDESPSPHETPAELAERLALEKAAAGARGRSGTFCVLAADTAVAIEDALFGKPRDEEEAEQMLMRLAGRTHQVITGVAVRALDDGRSESLVATSLVRMRPISREDARDYARTGEPLDKAGGYALQGNGGRFVEEVVGSRSNVIGLPLEAVTPLLARFGVRAR